MAAANSEDAHGLSEPPPELIVVLAPDAVSAFGTDVDVERELQTVIRTAAPPSRRAASSGAAPVPVTLRRLFADADHAHDAGGGSTSGAAPADQRGFISPLDSYLSVSGVVEGHDELAHTLRSLDLVVGAYVKAPTALPTTLNAMVPSLEEPPGVTPDFTGRQFYLGPPPVGVGATMVHDQPGGRGAGVRIVDIEGAWRLSHEDLHLELGLLEGAPSDALVWRNHGSAVLGVVSSRAGGFGTTGIAPDASMFVISIFGDGMGSATAIRNAADALSPGDLLMIELHRPGPRAGLFGQFGYIPVEWWPDDFDAVSYAVRRGVVVVAAAGNGSQNLDDPVYDTPLTGFPPGWRNPFKRRERDSGAILVGAGAPPEGVNGSAWGPVRSRLDFSNYGSAVDAHGPGREVTTCGYGDLQSGSEDRWYTQQFSGTSSALPTVVGALACVQGMLTASGAPRLTPELARRALHATGTPQQAGPGAPHTQRIGAQPDVPAIVKWARARSGDGGTDPGKQNGKEDSKESEAGPRKFPKLEKNEFKDMLEASRPPSAASIGSLEQRVEELENTVGILMHFIPESQRPNLGVPEEP